MECRAVSNGSLGIDPTAGEDDNGEDGGGERASAGMDDGLDGSTLSAAKVVDGLDRLFRENEDGDDETCTSVRGREDTDPSILVAGGLPSTDSHGNGRGGRGG